MMGVGQVEEGECGGRGGEYLNEKRSAKKKNDDGLIILKILLMGRGADWYLGFIYFSLLFLLWKFQVCMGWAYECHVVRWLKTQQEIYIAGEYNVLLEHMLE